MYVIHAFNSKTGIFEVIGFRETSEDAKDSAALLLQYNAEYIRCVITHTTFFVEVR